MTDLNGIRWDDEAPPAAPADSSIAWDDEVQSGPPRAADFSNVEAGARQNMHPDIGTLGRWQSMQPTEADMAATEQRVNRPLFDVDAARSGVQGIGEDYQYPQEYDENGQPKARVGATEGFIRQSLAKLGEFGEMASKLTPAGAIEYAAASVTGKQTPGAEAVEAIKFHPETEQYTGARAEAVSEFGSEMVANFMPLEGTVAAGAKVFRFLGAEKRAAEAAHDAALLGEAGPAAQGAATANEITAQAMERRPPKAPGEMDITPEMRVPAEEAPNGPVPVPDATLDRAAAEAAPGEAAQLPSGVAPERGPAPAPEERPPGGPDLGMAAPQPAPEPLYHASLSPDIEQFDLARSGSQSDHGVLGQGIYFRGDEKTAPYYLGPKKDQGTLYRLEHSMENPKEFDSPQAAIEWQGERGTDSPEAAARIRQKYEAAGHDGVIIRNPQTGKILEAAVFDPAKVRVAEKRPIKQQAPSAPSSKPSAFERGVNAGFPNAKPTSNLGEADSLLSQRYSSLDVPSRTLVLKRVRTLAENDEIFDSIVSRVPVDVMNLLGREKLPAKMTAHDKAMFLDSLSSNRGVDVPAPVMDRVVRATADAIAERNLANGGRSAKADLSAMKAGNRGAGEVGTLGESGAVHKTPSSKEESYNAGTVYQDQGPTGVEREVPAGGEVGSGGDLQQAREAAGNAVPEQLRAAREARGNAEAVPELTGVKHAKVAEERAAKGLDELHYEGQRRFGDSWASARERLTADPNAGRTLARSIAEKPRPLSAEETATLVQDRARINNEHRAAYADAADAMERGDVNAEADARARIKDLQEQLEHNDKASKASGYEQGFGLAARRMLSRPDYTLAEIRLRDKVARGAETPKKMDARYEELARRIEEKDRQIAELQHAEAHVKREPVARETARKADREFEDIKAKLKKLATHIICET
jgi:hypothetical protein